MIEGIIRKSKEAGYAKGLNLKIDDVFSGEVKKSGVFYNLLRWYF
jgi:hypothetical protein